MTRNTPLKKHPHMRENGFASYPPQNFPSVRQDDSYFTKSPRRLQPQKSELSAIGNHYLVFPSSNLLLLFTFPKNGLSFVIWLY